MQTKDIHVGQTYRYSTWTDDWHGQKVTVIEKGVERRDGYGFRARYVRNGVKVKTESGHIMTVASREIRESWSDFKERDRLRREMHAETKRHTARLIAERAGRARLLDDLLTKNGVESTEQTIWYEHASTALYDVGFDRSSNDKDRIRSAIVGLNDYMRTGKVQDKNLGPLFAMLEQDDEADDTP